MDFRLTFDGDPSVLENPERLRSLCRKEVERFDEYLRRTDPQFKDGLARFERLAVEGYLYQKARGHLDASEEKSHLPVERKDGETTSP